MANLAHTPIPIPKGVVATGEFVDAAGAELGTMAISRTSVGYSVKLPDLALGDPSGIIMAMVDSPFDFRRCGDDNVWELGFPLAQIEQLHGDISPMADSFGDPSFFTDVIFVKQIPDVNHVGCTQPILARATLTWTSPDTHPWITVADRGPASGAQGEAVRANGVPFTYRTAKGDTWKAIAARFGLSGEDLSYLNPIRHPGGPDAPGTPALAYADQVLNLDPANRGNSESRRPGVV